MVRQKGGDVEAEIGEVIVIVRQKEGSTNNGAERYYHLVMND